MWSDWLTPIRWLVRPLLLAVSMLILLAPTVICQGQWARSISIGRRGLDEFMLNTWSGIVCFVFGIRPRTGGNILPGPVLVVANHISWLDIQALHSVASMSFIAKAEIEKWPLLGFLATSGGTVFHRRGSHDSSTGVVQQMHDKLAAGRRVAVFPEGGILPGKHVKRFHARMFRLAIEADCPVQPVMIRYMRDGVRQDDVTFLGDESFGRNLLRLLGRPSCTCELRFMSPVEALDRKRRELAGEAESMVKDAYDDFPQEAQA